MKTLLSGTSRLTWTMAASALLLTAVLFLVRQNANPSRHPLPSPAEGRGIKVDSTLTTSNETATNPAGPKPPTTDRLIMGEVEEPAPPKDVVFTAITGSSHPVARKRGQAVEASTSHYDATFLRDEVVITVPPRGTEEFRPRLSYVFEELRVGEDLLASAGPAVPEIRQKAATIAYNRGSVEEQYLLRSEAVEQQFIIRELPKRGQIAVKGKIATNLTPPPDGTRADALSFTHQGEERIFVRDGLAYDAEGRSLKLQLTCSGSSLSMSLDADWVKEARLPIVIDPLIGGAIIVDPTSDAREQSCDVAYNSVRNEWLVVWKDTNSTTILGQRLGADGSLLGSTFTIGTSHPDFSLCLSYASTADRYLVAWPPQSAGGLAARILNGDGTLYGSELVVDSLGGTRPAAAFDGVNWYVCHYRLPSPTTAHVRGKFISTNGDLGADAHPDLSGDGSRPSVAFSGGSYVVSWKKNSTVAARTMTASGAFGPIVTVEPTGFTSGFLSRNARSETR